MSTWKTVVFYIQDIADLQSGLNEEAGRVIELADIHTLTISNGGELREMCVTVSLWA